MCTLEGSLFHHKLIVFLLLSVLRDVLRNPIMRSLAISRLQLLFTVSTEQILELL